MDGLIDFFGRLHPLLVHLPIGFLLIGIIIYWWNRISKRQESALLTSPIFLLGAIAAVISCATGYVLSQSSDYDMAIVNGHRNAGLLLALISTLFWWLTKNGRSTMFTAGLSISMLGLLVWTGHQGATLTHGAGFLFRDGSEARSDAIKPIANVNEAMVYADIIQPILHVKCTGCHGPEKQKGKLRLDNRDHILNGGKNGNVLVGGDLEKSEMLNRMLLPPDDDDHMPPKEKGQLSQHQVALIKWWIRKGASFDKKVKDLEPDQSIHAALAALGTTPLDIRPERPLPEVKVADTALISVLRRSGVIVVPIAQGSNYLSANLLNCTHISDTVLQALKGISEQLIWLKAEGPLVNDEFVKQIGTCKKLKRLSLAHATLTEASIKTLQELPALEYLNLFGTSISERHKLSKDFSR
jgi:uncharacterized membrane protein